MGDGLMVLKTIYRQTAAYCTVYNRLCTVHCTIRGTLYTGTLYNRLYTVLYRVDSKPYIVGFTVLSILPGLKPL